MNSVDLNSDLGEWDVPEKASEDAPMFRLVTSANIASGFHAGNRDSMLASARLAAESGVALGAHPSYRDREGFGRRDQDVDATTLRVDILEQVDALMAAATEAGTRIRYLKPHGALYNRIAVDPLQADAVARAARDAQLPILGLASSEIHKAADVRGVPFFREAFVDRAYLPNGALAPRTIAGAVLADPQAAASRALRMVAEGTVEALNGTTLHVHFDSLCVHGDSPGALAMAQRVREQLAAAGIEIRPFA